MKEQITKFQTLQQCVFHLLLQGREGINHTTLYRLLWVFSDESN